MTAEQVVFGALTVLDDQGAASADQGPWRIEMLANSSGFPISQGRDDFGYRFGGPALNGKSISIRWEGQNLLAMRAPPLVASDMAKDAGPEAGYSIGHGGFILFPASGAHADTAIRRTAALIRALPDAPLTTYWEKTRMMPASTEAERLVKQRIGQDIFRASLEDYWSGCCPITGIADRALLRASHTKPWADCEWDEERLDVYNGFLLAAHLDAAFDAALMTFDEEGRLLWSSKLSETAKSILEDSGTKQIRLALAHRAYLAHHNARFRAQEAI